jgi:hypothetical protein
VLQFNSALLAAVGSFTGDYAPYQSVHIRPHCGGVLLVASDHGKVTAVGFDRQGTADEALSIIPSTELLKSCAGIKTAERGISIDGDTAIVTTYYKTSSNKGKELPIQRAVVPFPEIDGALAACVQRWGSTPKLSETAGRYRVAYLERAIKAAGLLADSLVLSAFDGGPLRLQGESIELIILVMPQTAEPIPALPEWIQEFSRQNACQVLQSS